MSVPLLLHNYHMVILFIVHASVIIILQFTKVSLNRHKLITTIKIGTNEPHRIGINETKLK